ncbi:S8 family serine peptidase [Nonomuraea angiospora]|uniref:S8 family serine peptidase n=1 Tax=Nonomuraea angiospora TaxID=46172 RepID=UPI0033E8555C
MLDSGIDATHPDLAGKVVARRDFTEEPDERDVVGHGTHVASTIAGSGAASGGRYRGVAPDAALLDGRVCESVFCSDSAIALPIVLFGGAETTTLRLPKGRWLFDTTVLDEDGVTLLVQPEVRLDADRTVDADARLGRPLEVTVRVGLPPVPGGPGHDGVVEPRRVRPVPAGGRPGRRHRLPDRRRDLGRPVAVRRRAGLPRLVLPRHRAPDPLSRRRTRRRGGRPSGPFRGAGRRGGIPAGGRGRARHSRRARHARVGRVDVPFGERRGRRRTAAGLRGDVLPRAERGERRACGPPIHRTVLRAPAAGRLGGTAPGDDRRGLLRRRRHLGEGGGEGLAGGAAASRGRRVRVAAGQVRRHGGEYGGADGDQGLPDRRDGLSPQEPRSELTAPTPSGRRETCALPA